MMATIAIREDEQQDTAPPRGATIARHEDACDDPTSVEMIQMRPKQMQQHQKYTMSVDTTDSKARLTLAHHKQHPAAYLRSSR